MNSPSRNGVSDHKGKDGPMHHRHELYLALSTASIISISGIAPSSARSEVKSAAITFTTLSFIATSILGVGYLCRQFRSCDTANPQPISNHFNNSEALWKSRRKDRFEKIAVILVFVLECITSGLVLYPRFDATSMAMAGNEVWNPNLFYTTWSSLCASAYLTSVVFLNEDCSTHDQPSSVKSAWFMSLFSTTCTATCLLIIQSGPACRGDYIDDTPYCSSALAAGSVSAVCAVALLACGVCQMQPIRRNIEDMITLKLRTLMMIISATALVITQCAIVAKVTAPSGPGHATSNTFITTWMSLIVSLLLWKSSIESCFMLSVQHEHSLNRYLQRKSTSFTDDEVSSDEDPGYSCDQFGDMPTDIPNEVQAGDMNYWHNLRGPDPEGDLSNYKICNSRRQFLKYQARAEDKRILEEADAILFKVAELICREDPRGIRLNDNACPNSSNMKRQFHSMEPPSVREESVARPRHPSSKIKVRVDGDHKHDERSRPVDPVPTNTDTFTSSASLRHHVRTSKTHSPTARSRASALNTQRKEGDTRRSSASILAESSSDKIDPSIRSTPVRPPPQLTRHQTNGKALNEPSTRCLSPGTSSSASTPNKPSPDSEMRTVPFDVLFRDNQSFVTDFTESHNATDTGTNAQKRTLSAAVTAALHAVVSANAEKRERATNDETIGASYSELLTDLLYQSLKSSTNCHLEGLSLSLPSNDRLDDSFMSPMTGEFSQSSTLEHAKKLRTYSDLEDSKHNIQGKNETRRPRTPNSTSIVGILKHSQHSGSQRKTPSQSSSKMSVQASTQKT